MSIVKYWWTLDGAEELCQMKTITSQDNLRCYNCEMVLEQGINIKELEPLRRINYKYIPEHIQPEKYYICIGCSKLHIENVPGRNNINYKELIQLLKTANTVDEINNRRYEIGALLPSIYIMFGYLQGNLVAFLSKSIQKLLIPKQHAAAEHGRKLRFFVYLEAHPKLRADILRHVRDLHYAAR